MKNGSKEEGKKQGGVERRDDEEKQGCAEDEKDWEDMEYSEDEDEDDWGDVDTLKDEDEEVRKSRTSRLRSTRKDAPERLHHPK